jgi:hypothetical protein
MRRVQIGTCSGPAEAALVRAAFGAHGIHVLINAEHHASMLGGLGGSFVPLHIYVDRDDAEEASALLADLRARDHEITEDDLPEGMELEAGDDASDDEIDAAMHARAVRRQRIVVMVLMVLGVGAVSPVAAERPELVVLVVGACLGALIWSLRGGRRPGPEIPRARIRR